MNKTPWLLNSATLYNKTNSYFYVKLPLSRTLVFYALFYTGVTFGVYCATFTFGRCPGASID